MGPGIGFEITQFGICQADRIEDGVKHEASGIAVDDPRPDMGDQITGDARDATRGREAMDCHDMT